MLDVLGLIARTCWVARNGLARTCRALSAPVDPAVFAIPTVTDELIESLLPNGIRHGLRVMRAGCPTMLVVDYHCGRKREMISYVALFDDGPLPSVTEFIATGYDGEKWTRRIEWNYRRVRFTFTDSGWGDRKPSLDMMWDRKGRTRGITMCGRSLTIHAEALANSKTVTREELTAWAEAAGYIPMDAEERRQSEYIDMAL